MINRFGYYNSAIVCPEKFDDLQGKLDWLKRLLILNDEKESEKALNVCVNCINALNREYYEKTKYYILGFAENRDNTLKLYLLNKIRKG